MKRRRLGFLLLWCFMCMTCQAQKNGDMPFSVVIRDGSTGEVVWYVNALLLDADSAVVDTLKCDKVLRKSSMEYEYSGILPKSGKYILKCTFDRLFTPLFFPFEVELRKSQRMVRLPDLFMKRKDEPQAQMLQEVEVVATKLKFYFDKDTVVYNADAFKTVAGSVLEDLLKKMPDIQLKGNTILYKGNPVRNLLLNGKDFFNRDRHTILKHIPPYMVKEVRVFDKTKDSNSLIKREREMRGLTMDVRLKKEYSTFFLGDATAGLGTDQRYMGQIFGLAFSSRMRLSGLASLNNVNKIPVMSYEESYQNWGGFGDCARDNIQLRYNLDEPQGLYSLMGDVELEYKDDLVTRRTSEIKFYQTGDVFGRSAFNGQTRSFDFSTNHSFNFLGNTIWDFTLQPSFRYSHVKNRDSSLGATFEKDVFSHLGKGWLDSLSLPVLTEPLRSDAINRRTVEEMEDGHSLDASLRLDKDLTWKQAGQNLQFSLIANYKENKHRTYYHGNVDYYENPSLSSDRRNNYNLTKYNKRGVEGAISYKRKLGERNDVSFIYRSSHSSNEDNRALYLLHLLDGWEDSASHPLGELPSTSELFSTLDGANSHDYQKLQNDNSLNLNYRYSYKENRQEKYGVSINIPLKLYHEKLHYSNQLIDTTASRTNVITRVDASFSHSTLGEKPIKLRFSYNFSQSSPSMLQLLNIRDNSDPLVITEGNPHLKNAASHYFGLYLNKRIPYGDISFEANHHFVDNQIATSRVYNRLSGVTRYRPQNIDGNNTTRASVRWNGLFKRKGKIHISNFSNQLSVELNKNVDLSTTEENTDFTQSVVRNRYLTNMTGIGISLYGILLVTNAEVEFRRSTGNSPRFQDINAWKVQIGNTIKYEYKSWRASSEIRYERYWGYNHSQMNKGLLLCNMELVRKFSKCDLKLEVYDLFNQYKGVDMHVNGQGKIETITNILRRYLMFQLTYKFNNKK